MSDSEDGDNNSYYPIGQDVADMKRALRAGEEYLDRDAEWWAEHLQHVFAPELIEDVTGVPQEPQEPQDQRGPQEPQEPQEDDFDQAMMRLAAFRVDGIYYDPAWEVNFPMFDGEAPEGHPHPRAFAVNYARHERNTARQAFRDTGENYVPEMEAHFPLFPGHAPRGHPHPRAFEKGAAPERTATARNPAPPPDNAFSVHVKTLTGVTHSFAVTPRTALTNIYRMMQQEASIAPMQMQFTVRSQVTDRNVSLPRIEDEGVQRPLSDFNLFRDTTIHLILRLGRPHPAPYRREDWFPPSGGAGGHHKKRRLRMTATKALSKSLRLRL